MTTMQNALGTYRIVLKGWHKALGSKPTAEMFQAVHALGCRPGKQALARAMELRSEGATDGQVKMACIIGWGSSGSHHNKRRDLIAAKWVRRDAMPALDGHTVYKISLTDKGVAKIKETGEPAAPAKKPRVKKAPVKKDVPVVDVPVVDAAVA